MSLASSEWGPGPKVSLILSCVQKTPRIGRDSCNGEARRQKTSTALLTARLSSKFLCTTTLKHPLIWRHAPRLLQHYFLGRCLKLWATSLLLPHGTRS